MSKKKLIKRLSWYYPTERSNGFIFSIVLLFVVIRHGFSKTLFLSYGLLVMIIILFQGQYYWKLKLYKLTDRNFDQQKNINFFKKMKHLNIILIALMPIVFLIQLFISGWTIKPYNLFIWSLVVNIFAILEHINYYNRQLSIDNIADLKYVVRNKRLKIASLRKDLAENQI